MTKRYHRVIAFALAGAFLTCHPADAAMLCLKTSGAVFLREACRAKEHVVALNTIDGAPVNQTLDVQTVVSQKVAGPGLQQTDATCPAGYALTGGGAGTGDAAYVLIDSAPSDAQANTWTVIYNVPVPSGAVVAAKAICARTQ